jgi:hypothetical protein
MPWWSDGFIRMTSRRVLTLIRILRMAAAKAVFVREEAFRIPFPRRLQARYQY